MHRFYVPRKWGSGECVGLDAQESHHALRVLRLRAGDPVQLLNGDGDLAEAVLDAPDGRRVSALVNRVLTRPQSALEISLVVGLPKPKAMDLIIQKSTELGVSRVLIVPCERSVSRLDAEERSEKKRKWRVASIEALKQCAGFWLPQIEVFPRMLDCLERPEPADARWVGALVGDRKHPREYIDSLVRETGQFPKSIEVWIGPEGDFSKEEMDLLLSRGACPVSLGDTTLRSETAALYCACLLRYEAATRTVVA